MVIDIIDDLYGVTQAEPAVRQIICTKGNIKRIYNNVKTWEQVQEIIDRRTKEGFEIRTI